MQKAWLRGTSMNETKKIPVNGTQLIIFRMVMKNYFCTRSWRLKIQHIQLVSALWPWFFFFYLTDILLWATRHQQQNAATSKSHIKHLLHNIKNNSHFLKVILKKPTFLNCKILLSPQKVCNVRETRFICFDKVLNKIWGIIE